MSCSVVCVTSSVERNNRPLRSKKGPASGWRTDWMCSGSFASACASARDALSASSGVAASTHDDDGIRLLRKCRIELDFALAPGQSRRDELARVGADREILSGVLRGPRRGECGNDDDEPGEAAASRHERYDDRLQHLRRAIRVGGTRDRALADGRVRSSAVRGKEVHIAPCGTYGAASQHRISNRSGSELKLRS